MPVRKNVAVICGAFALLLAGGLIVSQKRIGMDDIAPSAGTVVGEAEDILGRWDGPEGTYLDLKQEQDRFIILINTLEGPTTFHGRAVNNQIEFERDGTLESLKKGDGEDTGMKWLLDKRNCLIVRQGEGYCRG